MGRGDGFGVVGRAPRFGEPAEDDDSYVTVSPDEGEACAHEACKADVRRGDHRGRTATRREAAQRDGPAGPKDRRAPPGDDRRARQVGAPAWRPDPGDASWGLGPKTAIWGRNRRNPLASSRIAKPPRQLLMQANPAWPAELACRRGTSRALHGKEGVRGSSPRVGSHERPANPPSPLARRASASAGRVSLARTAASRAGRRRRPG
jgi:hypothetical protein